MKKQYFKKHHKAIIKSLTKKYDFRTFSEFPGVLYLEKEFNGCYSRVYFGYQPKYNIETGYKDLIGVGISGYIRQDWLWQANQEFLEIIYEQTKYTEKYFKTRSSILFIKYWYEFDYEFFHLNLYQDRDMEDVFENRLDEFIGDYLLPLEDITKDLESMRRVVKDIDPIKLSKKYSGGVYSSTNALLLLSLLEMEGRDMIVEYKLKVFESIKSEPIEFEIYTAISSLLDNETNRERIKKAAGITKSPGDKDLIPEQEKIKDDLVDYPDDILSHIYIIDVDVERLYSLFSCTKEGLQNNEDIMLGDLYEESEGRYLGGSSSFAVVVVPFDSDSVFEACDDIGSYNDMETKLKLKFPKANILLIHQTDVNAIAYSKIGHGVKVQSALYMMDGSIHINGELSSLEQDLMDKNDNAFKKIEELMLYHFKSITGLDTPYCQEFANIKMKEI